MAEDNHIIIVRNDKADEQKKNKLTWSKYGHQVFHFKYWILGITVLGTALGYLGVRFLYNRSRESITTDITLNLALRENKDSYGNTISTNYMDGSSFSYMDIVATSHLEAVKNNNPDAFSSVSIDKITANDAISISPVTSSTTVNGVETTTASSTQFVLTTLPQFFGGEAIARNFIKALVNYEVEFANLAIDSYSIESTLPSSEAYFVAMEMTEMASAITNQYNIINETYTSLIDTFSGSLQINGGTLSSLKKGFDASISEQKIKTLLGEQNSNLYVNFDGSNKENAESKIQEYELLAISYQDDYKTITNQLNTNEALLKELTSVTQPTQEVSSKIVSLTDSISEAKTKLYDIESEMFNIGYTLDSNLLFERSTSDDYSYLYHLNEYATHFEDNSSSWTAVKEWYDNGVSFKSNLKDYYAILSTSYTECNQVNRSVYKKNYNRIYVAQSNMGTLNNHTNPLIGAIGGFVLFYLVSSLAFAFYGNSKENKKKDDEKETENE